MLYTRPDLESVKEELQLLIQRLEAAKTYAEKALELLRKTPDRDLENRARAVLNKCNQNK